MPTFSWLFVLAVMTMESVPIPHAKVQCLEIQRHTDGPRHPEDEGNAVLITDSRGRMYMEGSSGNFNCAAWADGYLKWEGVIGVWKNRLVFPIHLREVGR